MSTYKHWVQILGQLRPFESDKSQFLNKFLAKNFRLHQKKKKMEVKTKRIWPISYCRHLKKFYTNYSVHRNRCSKTNQPHPTQIKTLGGTASSSLHSRNIFTNIYFLSFGRNSRSSCIISSLHGLLAHYMVDLSKNFCKSIVHISCFQSRSFHEEKGLPLGKGFPILSWDCHKVTKIRFVTNEHDHNVWICVIPQLP